MLHSENLAWKMDGTERHPGWSHQLSAAERGSVSIRAIGSCCGVKVIKA